MKKIFAILLLAIAPMVTMGQTVMGIPFGSSYDTTKSALEKRFGRSGVDEIDGKLCLMDFYMGTFEFKFGEFYFQYQGESSFLYRARFQSLYNLTKLKEAKAARDYLYSLLKEKYEDEYLGEFTNDQKFKCYKFGINPKDPSKVLGTIELTRGKGHDNKERYYVVLSYGPIYYLDKASDF